MEAGPIPWDAIALFCEREGLNDNDALVLEIIIAGMDAHYLKWQREEADRAMAEAESGGSIRRRR